MLLDSTVEFWNDPLMPYVEIRRACQSRICYKSHSHPTFQLVRWMWVRVIFKLFCSRAIALVW
jgi:hypothetical protein